LSEAVNSILRQLDETLRPHGFHRHKHTWNRKVAGLIDVVDIQVERSGGQVCVNVGVLDPDVYAQCWLERLSKVAYEPNCTVRSRIGRLMDGREHWWPLEAPETAAEMAHAVTSYTLPFLERMHLPGALEEHLERSGAAQSRYPPPAIYLALLKHRRGDRDGCHSLLQDLCARTNPTWRERVEEVLLNLSLDEPTSESCT